MCTALKGASPESLLYTQPRAMCGDSGVDKREYGISHDMSRTSWSPIGGVEMLVRQQKHLPGQDWAFLIQFTISRGFHSQDEVINLF